jgi:hypothetical protein
MRRGKLEQTTNIWQAASDSVSAVHTYFGGRNPGLLAQRSRFSITFSWLGLVGAFWSLGLRDCLVSLVMGFLHYGRLSPSG